MLRQVVCLAFVLSSVLSGPCPSQDLPQPCPLQADAPLPCQPAPYLESTIQADLPCAPLPTLPPCEIPTTPAADIPCATSAPCQVVDVAAPAPCLVESTATFQADVPCAQPTEAPTVPPCELLTTPLPCVAEAPTQAPCLPIVQDVPTIPPCELPTTPLPCVTEAPTETPCTPIVQDVPTVLPCTIEVPTTTATPCVPMDVPSPCVPLVQDTPLALPCPTVTPPCIVAETTPLPCTADIPVVPCEIPTAPAADTLCAPIVSPCPMADALPCATLPPAPLPCAFPTRPNSGYSGYPYGQISLPQCSCSIADQCIDSVATETGSCMEECDGHLEQFGSDTSGYMECFSKYTEVIEEARSCMLSDKHSTCSDDSQSYIQLDQNTHNHLGYEAHPDSIARANYYWMGKPKDTYSKFQRFYQCTRNCMRKKLNSCAAQRNCAIKLPDRQLFQQRMKDCMKSNYKISFGLLRVCQCIAYEKKVTDLIGQCAVIGNNFFMEHMN